MANTSKLWIEVRVELRWHPKLISSAKSLAIPKVYLEGHLVSLWSGALEYAEDGDLWRGDEERSIRFIESLAEIPDNPGRFIEVLRLDHWLEGWLIHDWLDHAAKYLIAKYKSHNRERLVEIWAKHGKVYGREQDNGTSQGKLLGMDGEVVGTNSDPPLTLNPEPLPLNQKPITLNPRTLNKRKESNPMGGAGGEAGNDENAGSSNLVLKGSRVQGYPNSQAELTGAGMTHKEVFEVFMPLLAFHSVLTLESFYERVKHCRTTPAQWMMLFLDKVQAVYRDRDGTTLIDTEDADPVAMTMAGLLPNKNRRQHHPTDAARQLFVEIMIDYDRANNGGKAKWLGRISAPAITLELERRKGKAGKIR